MGSAHCARREIVTSHAAFGYLAHAVRPRTGRPAGVVAGGRAEPARARGASSKRSRSTGSRRSSPRRSCPRSSPRPSRARRVSALPCSTRSKGSTRTRSLPGTTTSRHAAQSRRARGGARLSLAVELGGRLVRLPAGAARSRARRRSQIAEGEFVAVAGPERRREDDARPGRARARAPVGGTCAPLRRARPPVLAPPRPRVPRAALGARRRRAGDRARSRLRREARGWWPDRADASPRPRDRLRRDRARRSRDQRRRSDANALGRDAAACVHRQGARRPTRPPRARRADDGGRRGVAGVARGVFSTSCTRSSA